MRPPLLSVPAVLWFLVVEAASPPTVKPPTVTGPEAVA